MIFGAVGARGNRRDLVSRIDKMGEPLTFEDSRFDINDHFVFGHIKIVSRISTGGTTSGSPCTNGGNVFRVLKNEVMFYIKGETLKS